MIWGGALVWGVAVGHLDLVWTERIRECIDGNGIVDVDVDADADLCYLQLTRSDCHAMVMAGMWGSKTPGGEGGFGAKHWTGVAGRAGRAGAGRVVLDREACSRCPRARR